MASKTVAEKAPAKPAWAGKLGENKSAGSDVPYAAIREELAGWCEESYKLWQEDPLDWRIIQFETTEDANDAHAGGKWYCRIRPEGELTFARKKDQDPTVLVYRVRDKVSKPRSTGQDTATAEAQPETVNPDQDTLDVILGEGTGGE